MKLTGKKLILILLYAPTTGKKVNVLIAGRTRIMKMGFLFREEVLTDFKKDKTFDEFILPEYFAWKYGPFSGEFLNDLEFLVNQGYIRSRREYTERTNTANSGKYDYWVEDINKFDSRGYDNEIFELTERKGITKAKEIWTRLSENQMKYLSEFKEVLNRVSLDKILEYIYKKYRKNGYTDKSLIRERYLA